MIRRAVSILFSKTAWGGEEMKNKMILIGIVIALVLLLPTASLAQVVQEPAPTKITTTIEEYEIPTSVPTIKTYYKSVTVIGWWFFLPAIWGTTAGWFDFEYKNGQWVSTGVTQNCGYGVFLPFRQHWATHHLDYQTEVNPLPGVGRLHAQMYFKSKVTGIVFEGIWCDMNVRYNGQWTHNEYGWVEQ